MEIVVLRLGHRIARDKRITTHICLVARALGANKIIISGEKDQSILNTVIKVNNNWGEGIDIEYRKRWKEVINEYKKKQFCLIHLTMYGEKIQNTIQEIRKKENILIIVGGEKVPSEIYKEAEFNIGVTNQPHSEVAALAIFLDKYFDSTELEVNFKDAKLMIKPDLFGKKIIHVS
ncbi:tRNA (cytidine(56)-2'-O)-methyltransferase [Candidatus Micrarchaeota archaeon]|nr:tRNA (cytidine(56)-2'-O)-methyltransferase [Candidatus Micrarchaeota archaeon]